jgi:GNAT superfamily N-acetyltransferase
MWPFMELISNYSMNDTRREQLYPLFQRVFGIPADMLKDFYERGFWDPTYCPYTLFEGNTAISNVSMFSMPMMINQKQIRAAGIQSVMTHPDHRKKGYMKHLFSTMLSDIESEYDSLFLFTESPELYTRYGFKELDEYYYTAGFQHKGEEGALQKLNLFEEQDKEMMRECFLSHQPVSEQFAPINHASSFYLNMYNPFYGERLYYAKELKAIIVYEVEEETLKLYDVVAEAIPSFEQLSAQIPDPFLKVEFYFHPELLQVKTGKTVRITKQNRLMIKGELKLKHNEIKMPDTAVF